MALLLAVTSAGCTALFGTDQGGNPAPLPVRNDGLGIRDGGGTATPESPAPESPSPETPSPETPSPESPSPESPSPESDGGPLVDDAGQTPTPDPAPPAFDPNWFDQDALFVCDDVPSSSPARIRRLERKEWTNTVNRPNLTSGWSATAANNPLDAPSRHPYSTYSEDVSFDEATLDLYFNAISEIPLGWIGRGTGTVNARTYSPYYDNTLWCISGATPDQACQDYWVYKVLEEAVLFRAPTTDEFDRLSAFLTVALGDEVDPAERPDTLTQAFQAAWMMTSALFKSEMGAGPEDANGRRRLSDAELERALANLMYRIPAGLSGRWAYGNNHPTHPGWTGPPEGQLNPIQVAAEDGTIADPAVIRTLVRDFVGGVDVGRFDIADGRRNGRGEYWLATRVGDFFREWLGYSQVRTNFKDTPSATAAAEGNRADLAFTNLLVGYYGRESFLDEQLDDTIARVILEDTNTIERLFTTTTWRLPSNQAADVHDSRVCTTAEDCRAGLCMPDGNGGTGCYGNRGQPCTTDDQCSPRCGEHGFCVSLIGQHIASANQVYDAPNVPATQEGRWVEVDASVRAGVLTHPAWLAAHGQNFEYDPSIINRGKWVREKAFCEYVPPLSQVMVEAILVPPAPEKSARDRVVESIEANPVDCMGCHSSMNSLGYPFEIYNHAGFQRATDHGGPPNGTSVIDNAPDPALNTTVQNAVELSQLLSQSSHVKRCVIRQAFRFFAGRDETMADRCTLQQMESAYDVQGSFIDMMGAFATSDAFLYRHDAGGTP